MNLVRLGRQAFDPNKVAGIRISEGAGSSAPGAMLYLEAGGALPFWGEDADALRRFVDSLPAFDDGGEYADAVPPLPAKGNHREQGG